MGKIAVWTAIICSVLLLAYYALFGYLGAGPVQKDGVPLWLRSVETGSGIFQASVTGLALIIGGLFAYYRFFKEETYSKRLQPSVSTAVSRSAGHLCVVVTATAKNAGQVTVNLNNNLTRFITSVRKLGDLEWTDYVVETIFIEQDWVRPGETISDEKWVEILDSGEAALKTDIVVAATEDQWGASDIVNLLTLEGEANAHVGYNTDTSDSDAESEGGIWSFLAAKARYVLTKKP